MSMGLRWRSGLAIGAMVLAALAPSFAGAASAPALAAHAEAGRAFDALRAAQPGRMPRLAEAEAGTLLRVLGDAPRFLDDMNYTPAELGVLSDLCDRNKAAITAYISFGAVQPSGIDASVVVRNVLEFQDELAVLQPFLARCIARQVPIAEAMLRQMGERQASQLRLGGLKRSQTSLLQLYAGIATCFSDPRFGPAYCGLLDLMAELAPVHARALPLASRTMAIRLLPPLQQLPAGPQREAVQRIVDAMSDDRCTALCLLGTAP
ncbi:hypothetical protein [Variovorax fucosicus]|uniref:hypothetical protein n=2 Tax=Variovorax fucosicus TaxID=3053517 RepID=UPI0025752202|nr:hypothetical protein [Variovorax sp. J22G47]MDM0057454.1 hypothetical protein [Variovorax sp. J22G47]